MIIIDLSKFLSILMFVNGYNSNGSKPMLIFANYNLDIGYVNIDANYEKQFELNSTKKLINIRKHYYVNDIEYTLDGNYIIWRNNTHIFGSKANQSIDAGIEVLAITDSTDPAKLSLDWIHNLLYYTDKNSIVVFKMNNSSLKYNVITTDHKLDQIKDIAVDPYNSLLFWTQWDLNSLNPKIMKSDQDGSHMIPLSETNIEQPLLLTLDFYYHRIYWIDVSLYTLSSISYDGKSRRTIIQSSLPFKNAVSIDMFKDHIYWVNRVQKSILYTNKHGFDGNQSKTFMKSSSYIYAIHIFDTSVYERTDNKCNTSKCNALCLPSRKPQNYKCIDICHLTDSFNHTNDQKCEENIEETKKNENCSTSYSIISLMSLVLIIIFTLFALFVYFRSEGKFGSVIRKGDNSVTFRKEIHEDNNGENLYDDIKLN